MKHYTSFFLAIFILALGVTTSALAFTFTTIDVPGSVFTTAFGINPSGHIVGFFRDSSGAHGYLRDTKGKFTIIDVPGASGTAPRGINPCGYNLNRARI